MHPIVTMSPEEKPRLLLLNSCFLTAFPLFQNSFTSLISNCFLFRTEGQSRRLKPFSTNQKQVTQGFLYPGGPCRVLLGFSPLFSLILLNPEGARWQERVNKVLEREINPKLKQKDPVSIINMCCFVCGNLLQEQQETKTIEYSPPFSAESFIPLATKYPGQKLQVS